MPWWRSGEGLAVGRISFGPHDESALARMRKMPVDAVVRVLPLQLAAAMLDQFAKLADAGDNNVPWSREQIENVAKALRDK